MTQSHSLQLPKAVPSLFTYRRLRQVALIFMLSTLSTFQSAGALEKSVGNLYFENNLKSTDVKVLLYHRDSTHRVWKGKSWVIPAGKPVRIAVEDRAIEVSGDWKIRLEHMDGRRSRKASIATVGANTDDGNWKIHASTVLKGSSPRVRLPIIASRGSATWTIDASGAVTSRIKYTAGAGIISKKFTSGLIVEFADGAIYTAWATKETGGCVAIGRKSGTEVNRSHSAIPVSQLNNIRRCYVRYSTSSPGSNAIRKWIEWARGVQKDADGIYKELKESDLVKDAVKILAG